MKEYIEREAAIDHLIGVTVIKYTPAFSLGMGAAAAEIQMLPAADVVEVRHGKNLSEDDPSRFECSECGWKCWDTYCGDTITYSFCPNCGAKMDKEE